MGLAPYARLICTAAPCETCLGSTPDIGHETRCTLGREPIRPALRSGHLPRGRCDMSVKPHESGTAPSILPQVATLLAGQRPALGGACILNASLATGVATPKKGKAERKNR